MKKLVLSLFAAFTMISGPLSAGTIGGGNGIPPLIIIQEESGGWSNALKIFDATKEVTDPVTGVESTVPAFPRVEISIDEMTDVIQQILSTPPQALVHSKIGDKDATFYAIIVDTVNKRVHGRLIIQSDSTVEGQTNSGPFTTTTAVNLFQSENPIPLEGAAN